jgi:hypothetical protein
MLAKFWNPRMSKEIKHGANNPEMEFEHQDLNPQSVYGFLIGLAVACVAVAIVLAGIYRFMDRYDREHQPPQNPLLPATSANTRQVPSDEAKQFPVPRLESNERVEINDFLLGEEDKLATYGWVDQKSGVVRIPIERAMQVVEQQGLPTTPRIGEIPPSEINVVNQAAQKADTSNIKKKGKK